MLSTCCPCLEHALPPSVSMCVLGAGACHEEQHSAHGNKGALESCSLASCLRLTRSSAQAHARSNALPPQLLHACLAPTPTLTHNPHHTTTGRQEQSNADSDLSFPCLPCLSVCSHHTLPAYPAYAPISSPPHTHSHHTLRGRATATRRQGRRRPSSSSFASPA